MLSLNNVKQEYFVVPHPFRMQRCLTDCVGIFDRLQEWPNIKTNKVVCSCVQLHTRLCIWVSSQLHAIGRFIHIFPIILLRTVLFAQVICSTSRKYFGIESVDTSTYSRTRTPDSLLYLFG